MFLSILIYRSYIQLNALKPGIYRFSGSASLLVSNCLFSCETENKATTAIMFLSILIYRSYIQLNALKPGIYRFSGSASLLVSNCLFSCAIQTEAIAAILILSSIFHYWHKVLEQLCQICGHFESPHRPRGV